MKAIEKLNLVNGTFKAMLQCARLDKPTGYYPEWADKMTEHFNDLARVYMQQAKNEMGILRAERAAQ